MRDATRTRAYAWDIAQFGFLATIAASASSVWATLPSILVLGPVALFLSIADVARTSLTVQFFFLITFGAVIWVIHEDDLIKKDEGEEDAILGEEEFLSASLALMEARRPGCVNWVRRHALPILTTIGFSILYLYLSSHR